MNTNNTDTVDLLIASVVEYRRIFKAILEAHDQSMTKIKLTALENPQIFFKEESNHAVNWPNTEDLKLKSCKDLKLKYSLVQDEIKNLEKVIDIMSHEKFVLLQRYMNSNEYK